MFLPGTMVATADGVAQTQFALDTLAKVMPLYEEMFDIEFPLPKLDILAVSPIAEGFIAHLI